VVRYEVYGGSKVADITYQTASGSGQQDGVDVPMGRTGATEKGIAFTFPSGGFAYISAQRDDSFGGGPDITCRIRVDGVTISENTARGGYSIATCSARVP
jgi:hypothetical protein